MFKILENNEIFKSTRDNMEDKVTSPVYGVFVISWLIVHWKFVYTALFVSEEKIWEATGGMLKSDYLTETFFNFSNFEFYLFFLLPFLFTWLLIWKFPKWVSIPAFRKSQEFEVEKSKIKLQTMSDILKEQLRITELTEQKTKKEKEIKQQEKEIKKIDPTIEWFNEFNNILPKEKDVQAIKEGSRVIYETNGRFVTNLRNVTSGYSTYISSPSLSRLDALGLIKMVSEKRDVMEFTEKGKFFIRELQKKDML